MRKIAFVVPYFGKLPTYFQIWLESCKWNTSIDWILFTNDKSGYDYPVNVYTHFMEFSDIQKIIKSKYDFEVCIDTPYKLCDYKIAYGDIFSEYLTDYDFWGFCDIDLIWGDIRKFYSESILGKYEKIGNQGHATIFRNIPEVNNRYKTILADASYIDDFSTEKIACTDVVLICKIYEYLNIPVYKDAIYAGLEKYEPGFFLQAKPKEENWKNRRQVFLWENGKLYRYYLNRDESISKEEYLYIHFFARPMKNQIDKMDRVLIYPDVYKNYYLEITSGLVKKYGKKSKLLYYIRVLKQNKKRLSVKKIISYFHYRRTYELKKIDSGSVLYGKE